MVEATGPLPTSRNNNLTCNRYPCAPAVTVPSAADTTELSFTRGGGTYIQCKTCFPRWTAPHPIWGMPSRCGLASLGVGRVCFRQG